MADPVDSSSLNGARVRLERERANINRNVAQVIREKHEVDARGKKDVTRIHEHSRKAAEMAFKQGQSEVENLKELNLKNIENLNRLNLEKMQALADKTRTEFEAVQERSITDLHNFQREKMESFLEASTKAEDPFYRPKQFSTEIEEQEDHFNIKIKLPSYEARNVNISGYSNQLKISFSRAYEANTPISSAQENSTRTHESVTETYYMPTNLNFKQVAREYKDDALYIKVAKANPLQFIP